MPVASKNVVFKQIGNKVALLAEGAVLMTRSTTGGTSAIKQLKQKASNVLYDWERANKAAVHDGKLMLAAKNTNRLSAWIK